MKTIYTIGYEKISTPDFIDLLKRHNIKTLVDVRENPFSMRKDFIRKHLENILAEHGINYVHAKPLGNPKFIRKKYKEDKDTTTMLYRYLDYIKNKDTTQITSLFNEGNICLMCYEANPFECHRTMIAYELFRRGYVDNIEDLRARISRDEILLFCQNISNLESILFRDYMYSWYSGASDREERISPCLPSSV